MKEDPSALLVHIPAGPFYALKQALENQFRKLSYARTCREASRLLAQANPPHLVFTDTTLPDGTWEDVLACAAKAPTPVNVIVVGRLIDTKFYVEVIERGAFDFIVPPFAASDLNHIVRCAVDNISLRRQAQAREQESRQGALASPLLHPGL